GQLEGALAKLAKSQDRAAQGAKEQLDIFGAPGGAVQPSDGTLRDVEDVCSDRADRVNALPDGANQTAAAMAPLRRAGAPVTPLPNGGCDGLREMRDELERLGGVVTPEAARQAEEFNDNLSRLKVAANGLWISLATELLPDLVRLTEAFVDGAKEGEGYAGVAEDISAAISTVAETAYRAYKNLELLINSVTELAARGTQAAAANPFSGLGLADRLFFGGAINREAGILAESSAIRAAEAAAAADEGLGLGRGTYTDPVKEAQEEAKRSAARKAEAKARAAALEIERGAQERAAAARLAAAEAARAQAEAERERLKALRELALAQESLNGVLRAQADEMGGPLARAAFEYQDTMVRLAGVEEELVRLGKLDEEQQVKLALARQQANDKFQRAVELNQSQKGPLEELLESMQLEIDLLGMGNAERITELELLRLIDEYRRRGIELSQEEIDAARERIRSKVDEVDALREQISALDQFRDSFEDNVSAVLDGSKSIKDAIRDLVNDFIAQMLRMAAHNFTEALFGQM